MHWLAQGSRKVQVKPGVLMATQNFKRNLFLVYVLPKQALKEASLNVRREGGKI